MVSDNKEKNNLKREILLSKEPILVDFYAPWCGPCQVQKAILKYFMEDHSDDVKLISIDIEDNDEISQYFNIRSVPTLLFIKDGEILCKKTGVQNKSDLLGMIKSPPN